MRPKGIVGLVIIIAIFLGIAYLLSDRFIERGMEKTGEAIVGAKVEVDNLNFSPTGLAISLDRLQVANPNDTWKNLFETGRMSFDMDFAPLIRKKVNIRDITIADIRVGAKRETDGKLPEKPRDAEPGLMDKAAASLKRKLATAPVLNLGVLTQNINVDAVIAAFDFKAPERIDSLKAFVNNSRENWQQTLSNFDPKGDLQRIESQLKEIKPQEIKGVEQLVATVDKTKRFYDTLTDYKNDIEQKKERASSDFQQIQASVASVDNWIQDDFNRIKNKVNLSEFTPQNVGAMLFGRTVMESVTGVLYYVDISRNYMPVAQRVLQSGKAEKPPRFEGQDIRFPLRSNWPDFLIENIFISGATNQQDTSRVLRLSGQVQGITSHPRVYGKPTTFQLDAKFPQSKAYQITGEIDHTGEVPAERFQFRAGGLPIGGLDLPARPYLPTRIKAERGDLITSFSMRGQDLEFKIGLNARPVSFGFADSLRRDDVISKVTSSVFEAIDFLDVSVRIAGQVDDLSLKIDTNIDNLLAQRINSVVGESAKLARVEIRKRVDEIVTPKRQELEGVVAKFQEQVIAEINQIQDGINNQLALIDNIRKDIEKQIAEEKGKGLEDVTKKLKGLIKN